MKFTFKFTITFMIAFGIAGSAYAGLSTSSREVLEVASQLGTEGEAARIRKELEAIPRTKVVTAVREGLAEGAPFSIVAARTANALRLNEVSGDLEKAFAKNDDWNIALALAAVASDSQKSHLAQTWQSKLPSYDSPTRIAILQTLGEWHYALTPEQFNQTLNDESAQVRIAAVRQFAVTKDKLSVSETVARYQKAFAMKPYQVRLSAMADYLAIPKAERAKYSKAIDEKFKASCKTESKPDVKTECEKILKGGR